MNDASKKQLKLLIDKRWDPRRGVGKTLGTIRYGLSGALILIVIFGRFLVYLPGVRGTTIGPIIVSNLYLLPMLGLVACWLIPLAVRRRTRNRAMKNDWFLCPWCRYALTDLEEEGVCPECGAPYRKEVCVKLYKCVYMPYMPSPQMIHERERKLWREAIELRDGNG